MSKTTEVKPIVEGPHGYRMPEDLAFNIEKIAKSAGVKSDTYRRCGKMPTDFRLVEGSRQDVSTVTTDAIDHDGEVVSPKGIALAVFRANPVVPYAHQYDQPELGKCLWIKEVDRGMAACTQYAKCPPNHTNWLPDAILSMMQEGMSKGKSIGFIPTSVRGPTKDEVNRRPELAKCRGVIEASTLLEYSVTPVPCNPEAIAVAVSKSFAREVMHDIFGKAVDEAQGIVTETITEAVAKDEPLVPFVSTATLDKYRRRMLATLPKLASEASAAKIADAIDRLRGRV